MEEITITRKQFISVTADVMAGIITDDIEDKEVALFVSLSGALLSKKIEEKLFGKKLNDDEEKED